MERLRDKRGNEYVLTKHDHEAIRQSIVIGVAFGLWLFLITAGAVVGARWLIANNR